MYKYNNTSCKGQLLTILSCGNPTEKRGGGVIGGGGGSRSVNARMEKLSIRENYIWVLC